MALDSSGKQSEQQQQQQQQARVSSEIGEAARWKLERFPNAEHEPENYEDLPLEFCPALFTSLERYLPEHLLNSTRVEKARFMRELLLRYSPETERIRVKVYSFYLILDAFELLIL